ncbi:MAG: hypothetical protein AB8F26_12125 [Phycisphaerales bacterium]
MRVLGVDLGLRITGYGCVSGEGVNIESGITAKTVAHMVEHYLERDQ